MRFTRMDVHRDACQICVREPGGADHQQRVPSRPDELARFAASLGPDDVVAIEATGPAAAIARILEPHAGQVVVVNPRRLGQIAARAKTDRIDAHTLSRLLGAGVLTGVWTPDEQARALRRLVSRRAAVIRARSRAKTKCTRCLPATCAQACRSPTRSVRPADAGFADWPCPRKSSLRSPAACARSIPWGKRSPSSSCCWCVGWLAAPRCAAC